MLLRGGMTVLMMYGCVEGEVLLFVRTIEAMEVGGGSLSCKGYGQRVAQACFSLVSVGHMLYEAAFFCLTHIGIAEVVVGGGCRLQWVIRQLAPCF